MRISCGTIRDVIEIVNGFELDGHFMSDNRYFGDNFMVGSL